MEASGDLQNTYRMNISRRTFAAKVLLLIPINNEKSLENGPEENTPKGWGKLSWWWRKHSLDHKKLVNLEKRLSPKGDPCFTLPESGYYVILSSDYPPIRSKLEESTPGSRVCFILRYTKAWISILSNMFHFLTWQLNNHLTSGYGSKYFRDPENEVKTISCHS